MVEWHHAPVHKLGEQGCYMVTAGTYRKEKIFNSASALDLLQDNLLSLAERYGWNLQAWAVLANHYHFVAFSPPEAKSLPDMLRQFHSETARIINRRQNAKRRRVWYQFWDSHITHQTSYLARLKYVHYNPVHHGLVEDLIQYRWCSAGWFEETTGAGFQRTVRSFGTKRLNVIDDY